MQVIIDDRRVELLPGMTVRHALLARYGELPPNLTVSDRWGNQVGLDGALQEGAHLKTSHAAATPAPM